MMKSIPVVVLVLIFLAAMPVLAADSTLVSPSVPPNHPPEIQPIGPQKVYEGQVLQFQVQAIDQDGDIPKFSYSCGTRGLTFADGEPGYAVVTFAPDFEQAGIYILTVVAADRVSADTAAIELAVINVNRPPLFVPLSQQLIHEGDTLSVTVIASDPDGTIPKLGVENAPANALFVDEGDGSGTFTFIPGFDQTGSYSVIFISQDDSTSTRISLSIVVQKGDGSPQLAHIPDQRVRPGRDLRLPVTAVDPDGTIPSLAARPLPPQAQFVDNGDGTGQLSMTADIAAPLSYEIWFIASDGQRADSHLVTITVVNPNPPIFGPDTLFVAPGGVDSTGYGTRAHPHKTIQYALNGSAADYVISVFPGVYNESVSFPYYAVELRSERGPDSTIIDGSGKGTPVWFYGASLKIGAIPDQSSVSVLDGFTIQSPTGALVGIHLQYWNSAIIRNNKIVRNRLGGISLYSSDALIYNNIIALNSRPADADRGGAGIDVRGWSYPVIFNNTIIENTNNGASGDGAGIHITYDANATMKNNIIAFNHNGYGVYSGTGSQQPQLSYALMYGNQQGNYYGLLAVGAGMVYANPSFVNAGAGDYRLACNSPAYNKADLITIDTLTDVDLAGNPRVAYGLPDLGALEFIDNNKHADFSSSVTSGCYPLNVAFFNTSTCIDEQWFWNFGDGNTSTVKTLSHLYTAPGKYNVTLRAIGDFDRDTLIRTNYIWVYDHLAADFAADTTFGCVPFPVQFTPMANDTVFTYLWDFGDGVTSAEQSPTHIYETVGRYAVQLIATNPCGPDTVLKEAYIYAEKKPAVRIVSSIDSDSLDGLPPCNPYAVRFHPVAAESLVAFAWDFGDNSTSTERDPVHTYTQGKSYSVQLIATGLCDTNRAVRLQDITLRPRPTATPRVDKTNGCSPLTVNFNADTSGVIASFIWYFGDGDSAAAKSASHTYTLPGKYAVKLVFTHDCGVDTARLADTIVAGNRPTVVPRADKHEGCIPLTVNFNADTSGAVEAFKWYFGDGDSAAAKSVSHTYTSPGKYVAKLVFTYTCGVDTARLVDTIIVHDRATVTPRADTHGGCAPLTVNFDADTSGSIQALTWYFGDGDSTVAKAASHTYTSPGKYAVKLVYTYACGVGTARLADTIVVRERSAAILQADTHEGCTPLTVSFDADTSGSIQALTWYFGDGDSAVTKAVSHTYTSPGKYAVKLVFTDTCGVDTAHMADTIVARDLPAPGFSCPEGHGYAPYSMHFVDQSTNQPSEWNWEFGDGESSGGANPLHTYARPGQYSVALTVSNPCGSGTRLEKTQCMTIAGYELIVGQPPLKQGDTTTYPLVIDTVLAVYPNPVSLTAGVQPTPYRGSLSATFSTGSGTPRFGSNLRLVPSGDLPSGTYTVAISAADPVLGYEDRQTVTYQHVGRTMLALIPDTLNFDSVETGKQVFLQVHVANIAPAGSGYRLAFRTTHVPAPPFSATPLTEVSLPPDSSYPLTIGFLPTDRITYGGAVQFTTDDPVVRDTVIFLVGRGIPEQIPPTVVSTDPGSGERDVLINSPITLEFSEPVRVESTDTTVIVRSWRLGRRVPGRLHIDPRSITFTAEEFWPPLDSLFVDVIADRVTDTVFNRLDGNGNGLEEKSPTDDYRFRFVTGPGVFPGDADDNRQVDERDVLPIGRFWERTGPERPLAYAAFTMQPAHQWPDSAATYADANGDGVIDSLDICPILEFWSAVAGAPLAKEQAFLQELAGIDMSILRAIYNAIDYCPKQSVAAVLKGILAGWIEQKAGVPTTFELFQNYPNPFNARTVITYTLPAPTEVELVVFNLRGEKVAVLAQEYQPAGRHVQVWDGRNDRGETAASGMYFYRLRAGALRQARKMTLLK